MEKLSQQYQRNRSEGKEPHFSFSGKWVADGGGRDEQERRGLKGRGVTDLTDSGGGSRCGDGWKSHSLIKARGRKAEQEITDLVYKWV